MELLEMTNTLVKVNYGLDRLIYKCVCEPNGLVQYKKGNVYTLCRYIGLYSEVL